MWSASSLFLLAAHATACVTEQLGCLATLQEKGPSTCSVPFTSATSSGSRRQLALRAAASIACGFDRELPTRTVAAKANHEDFAQRAG
jgi:hypothetical protein